MTVSHDELVAAFFSVASILHGALSRQSHWRQPRPHRTCDQRKVSSGKGSVSGSGRVVAGLAQLVAAPVNGGVGPLLGHVWHHGKRHGFSAALIYFPLLLIAEELVERVFLVVWDDSQTS